jgi:mandelate racemase
MLRVSETAHWLEWQNWANPILQAPYAVRDGRLEISDLPGTGIEWDEAAVKAHLVE